MKTDPFIDLYNNERSKGKNGHEAFGIAAGYIAAKGTFDDLRDVYLYHEIDLREETLDMIEKLKNMDIEGAFK